jgi:hypothetical protein
MRTLLRFNPALNHGELQFAPALPHGLQSIVVKDMFLGDTRITVEATHGGGDVRGLPSEVRRIP